MNFNKIETNRLHLRVLKQTDTEDFLHYRSNETIAKYQYWEPFTREQAIDYIKRFGNSRPGIPGEWFQLGIELKETGHLIGDCSLKQDLFDSRIAEFGCNLSQDYQGKGIAAEAIEGLFQYAFEILKVHRIIAIVDCENNACVRLLERLKMRREGHYIKNVWFKGDWGSEYSYAILDEEWNQSN